MAELCLSEPDIFLHVLMHTCRKHAHLQGREKEIARLTESAFQDLLSKHNSKAVDDRGQTHMEVNKCTVLTMLCYFWNIPLHGTGKSAVLGVKADPG